MSRYRVSVWTGPTPGDGTDAFVVLKLMFNDGPSVYLNLDSSADDLEFNQVDTFYFEHDKLKNKTPSDYKIRYKKYGDSPGWRCDTIQVDIYDANEASRWKMLKRFNVDWWYDQTNFDTQSIPNLPTGSVATHQPKYAKHHHRNQYPVGSLFPVSPDEWENH